VKKVRATFAKTFLFNFTHQNAAFQNTHTHNSFGSAAATTTPRHVARVTRQGARGEESAPGESVRVLQGEEEKENSEREREGEAQQKNAQTNEEEARPHTTAAAVGPGGVALPLTDHDYRRTPSVLRA
jgi:hypothetical protein